MKVIIRWKYMKEKTNLVWIDLEMTGLDPDKDVIVEIATIITDAQLTILEEGPSLVIQQPGSILDTMDPWVKDVHGRSGLTDAIRKSMVSLFEAEERTFDCIQRWCVKDKAVLCGNSVWQDKMFLRRYMPKIIAFLNYRIIDVTSVKELLVRWYPADPRINFKKKDTHRALEDIKESIAELHHYRTYFFV